jgi:hypothetical protein
MPIESARTEGWAVPVLLAVAVLLVVLVSRFSAVDDPAVPEVAEVADASGDDAVRVALGFLEAYGAFDADRAIAQLAVDAEISLLIRSIGTDNVEGTAEEFRLLVSMLEAWRYDQTIRTCDADAASGGDTVVRCSFDYDFLGSDEIGSGPYIGSTFELTVRGGEVARVVKAWAFDRFSREMWEPFARWIVATHPRAATRMYEDSTQRGVRLDAESIRLWERHTRGYLRMRRGELARSDPDAAG